MKQKQIFGLLLLLAVTNPMFAFAQTGTVTVKSSEGSNVRLFAVPPQKGQKSDEVKALQKILSADPTIYPSGIATGYYGPLTEQAVKRVQERYGLPVTGVVDDATQNVFFPPQIRLTVLTPNGGETWDRSLPQTIQWETYSGPVLIQNREVLPAAGRMPSGQGSVGSTAPGNIIPEIYPLFHQASLDLVRDSNPGYVYHIGTIDLYQSSYTWSLPQDVAGGNDFRVRISVGGHVPCYWIDTTRGTEAGNACPMNFPMYSAYDTSDGVFSITGGVTPNPDVVMKLKIQVAEMEVTLNALLRQIQTLKDLLARL